MAAIRIDDLAPLESLSPQEVERIKGAGRRARLGLEMLEDRLAPATFSLKGEVLSIQGTPQGDNLTFKAGLRLEGGGVWRTDTVLVDNIARTTTPISGTVTSLRFTGGAGNDVFTNLSGLPSVQFGGIGDDRLIGGSGNDEIHGDDGSDVVAGQGGNDILFTATNAGDYESNYYC